jgi:hypothetical protein
MGTLAKDETVNSIVRAVMSASDTSILSGKSKSTSRPLGQTIPVMGLAGIVFISLLVAGVSCGYGSRYFFPIEPISYYRQHYVIEYALQVPGGMERVRKFFQDQLMSSGRIFPEAADNFDRETKYLAARATASNAGVGAAVCHVDAGVGPEADKEPRDRWTIHCKAAGRDTTEFLPISPVARP